MHISALAEKFVKDPRDVVKAGDVVKVKVMEVDEKRKRIALTMRLNDAAVLQHRNANHALSKVEGSSTGAASRPKTAGNPRQSASVAPAPEGGAMAAAFAKLKERA